MIELLIATVLGVMAIGILLVTFAIAMLGWIEMSDYLERRRRRR